MVRVSGLQQQVAAGMTDVSPDGMTSAEQLTHLRARVGPMLADAAATVSKADLRPALSAEQGLKFTITPTFRAASSAPCATILSVMSFRS